MTMRLGVRDLKIWQHRPRTLKSGNTAHRPNISNKRWRKHQVKKVFFFQCFLVYFIFFLFTFIYIPFKRKFSQLFDKKKFEFPISNGYLVITRKICNSIKISIFQNTFLKKFPNSRKKFNQLPKKRNLIQRSGIKTYVATAFHKKLFLTSFRHSQDG